MANKTRSSFEKRQKEVARRARQKEKQARRQDAKQQKAAAESDPEAAAKAEDPDLAGFVLGPQPPADEADAGEDEEEESP